MLKKIFHSLTISKLTTYIHVRARVDRIIEIFNVKFFCSSEQGLKKKNQKQIFEKKIKNCLIGSDFRFSFQMRNTYGCVAKVVILCSWFTLIPEGKVSKDRKWYQSGVLIRYLAWPPVIKTILIKRVKMLSIKQTNLKGYFQLVLSWKPFSTHKHTTFVSEISYYRFFCSSCEEISLESADSSFLRNEIATKYPVLTWFIPIQNLKWTLDAYIHTHEKLLSVIMN